MPTTYQTSVTPRGGRRREDLENQGSRRGSNEGLQKLSKRVSKPSEGSAPSMSERPTSPASLVSSRSAPVERNALPKHPGLYSPSTMSLNSQRSVAHLDDESPMAMPPTKQSPQIRPVRQLPTTRQLADASSTPGLTQPTRPGLPSETVNPTPPLPVSDVSSKGRPQTQSGSVEGPRALQPSVEEVPDGEMW